jgi:hypothetical protein
VIVGCTCYSRHGDRQPLEAILKEYLSHEGIRERHIQNSVILGEGTTLSLEICGRGGYASSNDVDDKYENNKMCWLGDTSTNDEVHGILERAMKG